MVVNTRAPRYWEVSLALCALFLVYLLLGGCSRHFYAQPTGKPEVGIWVVRLKGWEGGDFRKQLQDIRVSGATYILIRTHGKKLFQYNSEQEVRTAIANFHREGIRVFGWGYVYGDDPLRDGDYGITSVRLGVDGYIWNVEGDFERQPDSLRRAEIICSRVEQLVHSEYPNVELGYSSFWNVEKHPGVQHARWGESSTYSHPQSYWRTMKVSPKKGLYKTSVSYGNAEKFWGSGKKPIIPVGHAYNGHGDTQYIPPKEVIEFLQAAKGYGRVEI